MKTVKSLRVAGLMLSIILPILFGPIFFLSSFEAKAGDPCWYDSEACVDPWFGRNYCEAQSSSKCNRCTCGYEDPSLE